MQGIGSEELEEAEEAELEPRRKRLKTQSSLELVGMSTE